MNQPTTRLYHSPYKSISKGAAGLLSLIVQSKDNRTNHKDHFDTYTSYWQPVLVRYAMQTVDRKEAAQEIIEQATEELWRKQADHQTPEQIRQFLISEIKLLGLNWRYQAQQLK